ncbi:MAG: MBL fold metallo-hydrolase [Pacificimonas sp.]|jgi:glyoxylase-like metal-dependent hydrolase (beta-lactamase superfamily II)|nr:MBL fold metallo-hydrolase [Pacificimonas sp.]
MTDVSLAGRAPGDDTAAGPAPPGPPVEGETRRGLFYPHGRWSPEPGDLFAVAPGVHWLRMPMPFSLDHINLWILDGGDAGWTLVDTSIPASSCKDVWRGVLKQLQAEKPVERLICTHYHPDHLGLAGWLCRKTGASFSMTQTEYLMARMLLSDQRDETPEDAIRFSEKAGYPEEKLQKMREEGWGRFARAIYPLPDQFDRLKEGDELTIGGRTWEIVVGSGHTPEHACLLDHEGKLLIAGDQVLPRITSNISVHMTEPMANPLGDWLDSIEKLRGLPDDLLVLPAHGFPFRGLHERLDQLENDHRNKLGQLRGFLAKPRRAVDTFEVLFGRAITDSEYGMATGEALAHLRWLEAEGQARRETAPNAADLWHAA